jgi:DNA repair protein RadA/Sms
MARTATLYMCTACETEALQWAGRCPSCGEWNTFTAMLTTGRRTTLSDRDHNRTRAVVALRDVTVTDDHTRPLATGVSELDRVLGGGLVAGSATLLFGPPGVGKSTLLFQVLASVAATGSDVLLASAEESLPQVLSRAGRLGPIPHTFLAIDGYDVGAVEAAIERHRPAVAVVDSIQSVADPELPQATGSLAQVRSCVERLTRLAKSSDVPIVLVGHVTKDGDLAGPRAIEHLVDTVLSFDGDRHHALRILTAVKHRFGPAGEVGLFEMRDDGLRAVPDPGPLMLGDRMPDEAGSVVVPVLQGRRPLLVEVQALVGTEQTGSRPHTQGIDAARAVLLMAILNCRASYLFQKTEVFLAAVGGITITEPAADLAVAVALASALRGFVVRHDMVVFGEIGLAGEVRTVPGADRRLAEAYRAGFTRAIVPASTPKDAIPTGMYVFRVRTLSDALAAADEGTTGTMPAWLTVTASR